MFDAQRLALEVSNTPWLSMEGARNLPDGEGFKFLGLYLQQRSISAFLSLGPGRETIATLNVVTSETFTTWAEALAPCSRERLKPCEVSLTDEVLATTVVISWDEDSFTDVPDPVDFGNVVPLYCELRYADGPGPRIAGGIFHLTETNLDGVQ